MTPIHSAFPDLIDKMPEPDAVRDRLARAVREVQFLRQLLRLAERAWKERERAPARNPEDPSR